MAAVSVACAVAAALLLASAVIERVKPTPEPVAQAIDPWAPPEATAPPDAAPATPPPVELLHAVPSTVAVSSTVDNAAILPEHLVDRDRDALLRQCTERSAPRMKPAGSSLGAPANLAR